MSLGRVLSFVRLPPGGGDGAGGANPFAEKAAGAYQRALTLSGGVNTAAQLGLGYYALKAGQFEGTVFPTAWVGVRSCRRQDPMQRSGSVD